MQIAKDDGFPQYICDGCWGMLEIVTHFRQLCEKSDVEMRAMHEEMLVKRETTEFVIESEAEEEEADEPDVDDSDAEFIIGDAAR